MTIKPLCAILLLLSGLVPARADDKPLTAVEKEKQTLESFAAANKTCREWSDSCAVCVRHDDGTFVCSLPGIACEPAAIACRPVPQDTKTGEKSGVAPKDTDNKAPETKTPDAPAPDARAPDSKEPAAPAAPAK